jgi:hypothetical protein
MMTLGAAAALLTIVAASDRIESQTNGHQAIEPPAIHLVRGSGHGSSSAHHSSSQRSSGRRATFSPAGEIPRRGRGVSLNGRSMSGAAAEVGSDNLVVPAQ